MQIDYLQGLNEKYEDFIYNRYDGKVLVIESDGLDFENRPADFRRVIDRVDAELFGLFSEQNWKNNNS
jgi:deoxyadenosine/deoxycytidine kinase